MATEKQIAANRVNARKSTGPRTPEGKAAVSRNALKYGLRSQYFLLGDEAEKKQYHPIYAALHEQWQPATPSEEVLVERMALAHWKLAHLEVIESTKLFVFGDFQALGHIWPQQARLERCYDKARVQLVALQAERTAAPEAQPAQARPASEPSAPASSDGGSSAPRPKLALFVKKSSAPSDVRPAPQPAPASNQSATESSATPEDAELPLPDRPPSIESLPVEGKPPRGPRLC